VQLAIPVLRTTIRDGHHGEWSVVVLLLPTSLAYHCSMPGFGRFGRPGKPLSIIVGAVILLIAAWLAFSWFSAKFSDRYESFYLSLAEARKGTATTRGWIPDDILPRISHNIHEFHNLSPSRQWCRFDFATADADNLRKKLAVVDALPASVRLIRDPNVSWWPTALTGNLDARRIRKDGFDLYVIERPANAVMTEVMFFAVDWSKGRAFFYSTSKSNE
jgi:hypothetical protein